MAGKMLIVEDDLDIHRPMATVARELSMELDVAFDGDTGLARALEGDYSLVVLDLTLPGTGGMDICRRLRTSKPGVPIMILTSRTDEVMTVVGLELGADDYVTKPFRVREFVARARSILRRSEEIRGAAAREAIYRVGEIEIDVTSRTVTKSKKVIDVTRAEFDLLSYLAKYAGRVVPRQELMERVWGYHTGGYDGTITTCLGRVRSKLQESASQPSYIVTVRGIGYRMVDPQQPPQYGEQ